MYYRTFLAQLHDLVQPEHYLEIGVRNGASLALARCTSVGIDPAFNLTAEISADVSLFRTTSDEYFSRPDPLLPTGGEPFDLAFIDGLHLFEFALRDFINTERHCRPTGVIVFDDVLPRSVDEAARRRHTNAWTGDVYPIISVLEHYRPEVRTILVDTAPTGLMLVVGLDPTSTVLADSYEEIMSAYRKPDPQPVPQRLLDRTSVQPPERVLASGLAHLLREHRDRPSSDLRHLVHEQLATDLGSAYGVRSSG